MKKFKRKKRGPVPPKGGRVRISINLPRSLLPFVKGRRKGSLSAKIVTLIERMKSVEDSSCPDCGDKLIDCKCGGGE